MKQKGIWKKALLILKSMLVTFALGVSQPVVMQRGEYKSTLHYLYAQITNLLGEYSFTTILLFALITIVLWQMEERDIRAEKKAAVLSVFLAVCLLIGSSYRQGGNWDECFGNPFITLFFLVRICGYAILFMYLIPCIRAGSRILSERDIRAGGIGSFFGAHAFRNVFLLLLVCWLPAVLLSYPGNLCYDCLGQIEQGLGISPYSAHHPLFHTLILKLFIQGGRAILGNYDAGLFGYILFQTLVLALALAATVSRLLKRQVATSWCLVVTAVYVLSPMYSNMVSTAIKDVPFMAAVIWYVLLLEELLQEGLQKLQPALAAKLVCVGILVGLLRNNGIYVVVLTGICIVFYEVRKMSWKQLLILFLCLSLLPFAGYKAGNESLRIMLSAQRGSKGEMFSLPFQQTARYLQLYGKELTSEEKAAIEGVLRDVNQVAANYNPKIADPVKALYIPEAGIREQVAYFKVWFKQFWKHPAVYFQAFFVHVYGWFDPGCTNAIRYEASSELFSPTGLVSGADKLLIFVYRFAEYFPLTAALENVGIYTWILLLLGFYCRRDRKPKGILLAPLYISLLICMVSPCFFLHPRYAYPIMFTIPFLYACIMGEREVGYHGEK